MTPPLHTLYGVEMSYFTGKARAYLRWKGAPFVERSSDAAFFKEICLPRLGYAMIPVLVAPDGETLQDTTTIIDHFETAHAFGPTLTPMGAAQRLASELMELYADNWLLLPAMRYRWAYDAEATILEFGMNLAPDAPAAAQRQLGEQASAMFRGALPALGVTEATASAVEASYRALLQELDTHFRAHPFLLGAKPCAGDFGLVGALYAHLYRDATAGALLRRDALAVARYVERMMQPPPVAVWSAEGDYAPDDQIPETLIPVLRRMMDEQGPVLADTPPRLAAWKAAHPGEAIPRMIGTHAFSLPSPEAGGARVTGQRAVFPYLVWMQQRARAAYDASDGAGRARADALLDACGGAVIRETAIEAPVALVDHRLRWA